MTMSSWAGRIVVLATTVIAVGLALQNQSSAELPRVVPVVLSHTAPTTSHAFAGQAGSVDQVLDTSDGLLVQGWVGDGVDQAEIVVAPTEQLTEQKVVLFARPDVELAGGPRLSGFRVVLVGVQKASVHCIAFSGPTALQVVWSSDKSCK